MAGQLQRHPLTELLREISAGGLSGALRLARERARTVVYSDAGEIIYAASNLRAYSLLECVRRWNILSEEQLDGVQGKTSNLEFGAALLETGALNRETLEALMARQVSELLRHTLLWTEGDWEFDPRVRLAENTRVTIHTRKLLMESARRLPVELVAASFTDKSEKLFPETDLPGDIDLLPTEAFVLSRVDASLSLNELSALSGLPEAETLHAVYALALGGFLRRERWPQALSAEEIARGRAVRTAPPAPVEQAPAPPVVVAESKNDTKTQPVAQAKTTPEEPPDQQSEIEALFERIRMAADHYQMLGVRRSGSPADIKRAYYALAKRFHPDRFRRDAEAPQLARIESAFAQVAQAYDTLKDKTSRAVYDSKLLKQEEEARKSRAALSDSQSRTQPRQDASAVNNAVPNPAPRSQQADTPYEAEERFQQGLAALQQGNYAFAVAVFGEAARLAPNEPRYHAYFGYALARDKHLRRNAEAEFKQAIALDANNADYRVMLARFYSEIGLVRRAQTELDRVLSIEPQNKDARRLLIKLKGRG